MVLKLQMNKSPAPAAVPYHTAQMEPLPSTSTATDYKSEPLSLEMFNRAATNLNEKGVINLKKYKKVFVQAASLTYQYGSSHVMLDDLDPANNFAMGGLPMAILPKALLTRG